MKSIAAQVAHALSSAATRSNGARRGSQAAAART